MKQIMKDLRIFFKFKKSFILSAIIIITFLFISKPTLLQEINFSQAIYDEHKNLLRLTLTPDEKYRLYVPLNQIPTALKAATLLQEDQYFYWHPGVNPISLANAIWKTYIVQHRRFGGSTITMQVARIRFHINTNTWLGKFQQILRGLQLELFYSKNQILEAYLNLASYGGNIEGVGAASIIYFNRSVSTLHLPQELALVVMPQNPSRKSFSAHNHDELKESRQQLWLHWLGQHPHDKNNLGLFDLPLQLPKQHLPFLAPHFVTTLLQENKITTPSIITTLDLKKQKILETTIQNYLMQKRNLGINNAAAMLVDVRTMDVKALVGSGNFLDNTIQGQINGTRAKRSPGSTLKPFIYALALDQGIIHPYSVLKDSPIDFGGYSPDNFDYDFMGPVKAKDALTLSRNIPAIYLATKINHPNLYQFLQQANISKLKPESEYGLSLVLGGAEVTMEELVEMYATLANQGVWKPVRYKINDPNTFGKRLLSPEASFLVLDMLTATTRPHALLAAAQNNKSPIAWKTGTSSAYRDAWTIGVFGPYVLAVWVGDFNPRSNPVYVGKESAAPLFFAINDALETRTGPFPSITPDPKKLNLVAVDVCEASGALPTAFCPHTVKTWFIPGKSPIKRDTIFREVMIDPKTGLRACNFDPKNKFMVYEFWPSDLLKIFQEAGLQRSTPPAFNPECDLKNIATEGLAPQITSPKKALVYSMRITQPSMSIPLTVVGDADVRTFYWFVNQNFIGKTPRDFAITWEAKPGDFVVRVVDDHGRTDAVKIRVGKV